MPAGSRRIKFSVHTGEDLVKPRGIDFFVYSVSDIDKSANFYEHALGLSLISWEGPGWVEFAVGDTPTVLALRLDPEGRKVAARVQSGAIAIAVDDVKQAVDELRQEGVAIALEPGEQPSCHAAGISDPDGNLILLHRRKDGTVG